MRADLEAAESLNDIEHLRIDLNHFLRLRWLGHLFHVKLVDHIWEVGLIQGVDDREQVITSDILLWVVREITHRSRATFAVIQYEFYRDGVFVGDINRTQFKHLERSLLFAKNLCKEY